MMNDIDINQSGMIDFDEFIGDGDADKIELKHLKRVAKELI